MADAPTAPEWVRPGAKVMVRHRYARWSAGIVDRVYKRYCTLEGKTATRFSYSHDGPPRYTAGDRWEPPSFLYAWDDPEAVAGRQELIQRNRVRKVQDAVEQWAKTGDVGHACEALAVLQRAIEAADELEAAPDVASAP